MDFKCPHCGEILSVTKAQNITASKPVGRPKGDLAAGVLKATGEAIEEKVVQKVDQHVDAVLSGLGVFNKMANGSFSDESDGLTSGWSGAMAHALKSRDRIYEGGGSIGNLTDTDPENINKEVAARKIQQLLHGALNKEGEE